MNALSWKTIAQTELAVLLGQSQLTDSRAVGTATVYQLRVDGADVLAIALADGQALLVESRTPHQHNRRHNTKAAP